MTGNVFPAWLVAWPNMWLCRCRPSGVFCLCHLDVALRPMNISPNLRLLGLSLTSCLPRVFCRVLVLAVCQPLAVVLGLIRVAGSTLSFILGLPFWHLVPPLTREGALVLRLRSRRIPSKVGSCVYRFMCSMNRRMNWQLTEYFFACQGHDP